MDSTMHPPDCSEIIARDLAADNAELRRQLAERQRMEAELRAERDFLRTIVDSTPGLIYV